MFPQTNGLTQNLDHMRERDGVTEAIKYSLFQNFGHL